MNIKYQTVKIVLLAMTKKYERAITEVENSIRRSINMLEKSYEAITMLDV